MQSNQTEQIKHDIIKYQFAQFCKRNTQAIALILKALLQGSKHFSVPKENHKEKLESKNQGFQV
ncbi:hypothetical protein [uncultured Helicobacter sp.]|uniref:hypothetical protein n=1 Tax=uncultured Helicobacter sp. TaxID=175537 RepID=UPI0026180E9E|nr:hypothetical protein [uncultured Helicobacter sp.]